VEYIPFGKWKLYAPSPDWGKNDKYFVEDAAGDKRKITLSKHPEQIPKYLKEYIDVNTFKEYELKNEIGRLQLRIYELEKAGLK
jgi:hypothetical protein